MHGGGMWRDLAISQDHLSLAREGVAHSLEERVTPRPRRWIGLGWPPISQTVEVCFDDLPCLIMECIIVYITVQCRGLILGRAREAGAGFYMLGMLVCHLGPNNVLVGPSLPNHSG